LTLGQDPVTNAVCLNFLVYGAAWPFIEAGPALLERVDDLWHDPGVAAFAPQRSGVETEDDAGIAAKAVQMRLF
jgi:hypothetical protein